MDFKDVIIVKARSMYGEAFEGKLAVPRSAIRSIRTVVVTPYGGVATEYTRLLLNVQAAIDMGLSTKDITLDQKVVALDVLDDFKVVLGLLQGSVAAETLFGENK